MIERDDGDRDRRQRHIAGQLGRAHPDWMVMWGSYSRMFWAFPLFGPRGAFFAGSDPRQLEHRIAYAELEYRNARGSR